MADQKRATELIRALAPELLEVLKARTFVRLEEIAMTGSPSLVTKRRVVAWLRTLGAEITASATSGYSLVDRAWQMPDGFDVRVIERTKTVERVVTVEVVREQPITSATAADLVRALEAQGYEVSIRKVCKPTRAGDHAPSLLDLGKGRAA